MSAAIGWLKKKLSELLPAQSFKAFDVFEPPRRLTVSEWAREKRTLPRGLSAKAGRFEPFEFQVEVLDCLHDEAVTEVTLQFASQLLGKTEVINSVLGYLMDCDPCGIIALFPTHENSQSWSKTKLTPMLNSTPGLKEVLTATKSRRRGGAEIGSGENTVGLKQFGGNGFLVTAGVNSSASIAMFSCRVVLADELDKWPMSLVREGDPLALALKRSSTFRNAFCIKTSTPSEKGASRIELEYEHSDQRRWVVSCPRCAHEFVILWKDVRWPKGSNGEHLTESAYLECPNVVCGARLDEKDRIAMVKGGRWVASNLAVKRKRGYLLNGLNVLLPCKRGYTSWLHYFAEEFLESRKKGSESLRVFVNSVLAESWEESAVKPTAPEILMTRRYEFFQGEPKSELTLPEGVLMLTVGCDKQLDRVEAILLGWGTGEECWVLDYRIFPGDFEERGFRDEVNEWLLTPYRSAYAQPLRVVSAFFDSGDRPSAVYKFARECAPRAVFGIKGIGSMEMPWIRLSTKIERLFTLNVGVGKSILYSRLNLQEPGPGYVHFNFDRGPEFFEQLVSERLVTRWHKGVPTKMFELLPGKNRNEVLDAFTYGLAAMEFLRPDWTKLKANLVREKKTGPPPPRQRPRHNDYGRLGGEMW